MKTNVKPPTEADLRGALGSAFAVWTQIVARTEAMCAPIAATWKPSKTGFGRMCLLQRKQRTLLYLTPDQGRIWIGIVLGERAFKVAMASTLPDSVKRLLREAKPYAEGRGIRFSVECMDDISSVVELLEAKMA